MTTILLARHGETTWNREGRFQGQADPPLSRRGRQQARALARSLDETQIDAVYSSDLRRAVETAAVVARAQRVPLHLEPELREVDVGEWSGLTWEEIRERFPEGIERHQARGHGWESGESYQEMAERVLRALRRIAATRPGECVLAVVHGGTMRAVAAHIDSVDVAMHRRGSWKPAGNCEVHVVEVENGLLTRSGPVA